MSRPIVSFINGAGLFASQFCINKFKQRYKPEIIEEYGDAAAQKFNALGAGLFGEMTSFNMDPQTIADGVLKLVNMEKGTRPLPLDAIAEGTNIAFTNTRAEIRSRWLLKYS